ncbi:hypothetical protein HGG75_16725 [Ochrobactrum pseudogrignonense]|nr:hypothetical protein [Brucella pseudogrignonensis]
MTKKNTGSNGYQNLHIEVLVKGIGRRGSATAPDGTAIMMSSVRLSPDLIQPPEPLVCRSTAPAAVDIMIASCVPVFVIRIKLLK